MIDCADCHHYGCASEYVKLVCFKRAIAGQFVQCDKERNPSVEFETEYNCGPEAKYFTPKHVTRLSVGQEK